MHNYVDYRWFKIVLSKFISILLIYSIFFTTTANAASVGGWSMSNPIASGASTIYTGAKKTIIDGKNYIKQGTAVIKPGATQVAKVLATGGAAYALSVAVQELLGAVDWVLDPANNEIVYHKEKPGTGSYYINQFIPDVFYSTASQACAAYTPSTDHKFAYAEGTLCYYTSSVSTTWHYRVIYYSSDVELEEKRIPLTTVAARVISNADSKDDTKAIPAQVATTAAAADIVDEAANDNTKARPIVDQLNNSASTSPADADAAANAGTLTGTATSKPDATGAQAPPTDITLKFPVFCGWAPVVCEAAQVAISFPTLVTEWWNTANQKADDWAKSISEAWASAKDWAKDDKIEDSDNQPPVIEQIDIGALNTSTFKGTPGCPQPHTIGIQNGTFDISYEPICQFASKWSFIAPLIGFLSGAMILVGVGRKGEDGDI